MYKIKKIAFKHFKFFFGASTLEPERHNMLIYGENGSGKSSIYWGLYTFFQSVFKDTFQKVHKYFNQSDQSLKNRFADDADDSFIKIQFEDEHNNTIEKTISDTTVNTKTDSFVTEAAQASEFINYKLLSKIHDFKNPQYIDLFPIFEKEVLMFISFRVVLVKHDDTNGNTIAKDWWEYLKPGMSPRPNMNTSEYWKFQTAIKKFNEELKFYLDSITQSVNEYLEKFKQQFTVEFEYKLCSYDEFEPGSTTRRNHRTIQPQIILHAHFNHTKLDANKKRLSRPHTFLNEAKLTSIALAIRFAMLDKKLSSPNATKILVLDDLLLSLDMSNRDIVLDIILAEFTNYQLLILTHDKNFFELIRHKIKRLNLDDWKYVEMYEHVENDIPRPYIKTSDTYLDKAEKYFYQNEYEISGNFLRKEAEAFCKEFLPKKYHFSEEYSLRDLNGLIIQCKNFANGAGLTTKLFDDLDGHRKFVLNPTSHDSYDVPKFKSELANCLKTLKEIRTIRFEPFLKRGEQVEFELTLAKGTGTYKFEIILEDDFRLLKEQGKGSVISKGMINYYVTYDGNKGKLQHGIDSIKGMYEKNYSKSDKTNNPDFWEAVIFSNTGAKLNTGRKF